MITRLGAGHIGFVLLAFGVVVATSTCGGSTSTDCTPGASVACVGPGACSGYQVCKSDGTFDTCSCSNSLDASIDVPVAADVQSGDTPIDSPSKSDASNFNVNSIAGVVVWLKGDDSSTMTISGGRLSRWFDQTPHHNDAMGSSSDSTMNPTVVAGAIHSVQAVHFNQGTGSTGQMLTILDNGDSSLQWGSGDFYVAVVADFDNDASKAEDLAVGTLYSKLNGISGLFLYANVPPTSSNVNPSLGITMGTARVGVDYMWSGGTYNTGVAHVFAARRRGNVVDLIVDGASVVTGSPNTLDVSESSELTHIGAEGNNTSHRLNGDIGEIVAVMGILSTGDESGIEGYLKVKWGTP